MHPAGAERPADHDVAGREHGLGVATPLPLPVEHVAGVVGSSSSRRASGARPAQRPGRRPPARAARGPARPGAAASSAMVSVRATTSATGWPANTASRRASGSNMRSSPDPEIGRSSAVRTATTPGSASAARLSMPTMRACAYGHATMRAWRRPGRGSSAAYRVAPRDPARAIDPGARHADVPERSHRLPLSWTRGWSEPPTARRQCARPDDEKSSAGARLALVERPRRPSPETAQDPRHTPRGRPVAGLIAPSRGRGLLPAPTRVLISEAPGSPGASRRLGDRDRRQSRASRRRTAGRIPPWRR